MKRKSAEKYFKMLYDATFSDAVAYISGKTGNTAIADAVLCETYTAVFSFLLRQKEFDESTVNEEFYSCLNRAIDAHNTGCDEDGELYTATKDEVDTLNDTEIEMTDGQAMDDLFVKKAHSYVLQKSAAERKVFILHYYEGYSIPEISRLLGIPEQNVYGYLKKTASDIQHNFLSKYISE